MYAVIRRYQFDPKSSDEISRHVREGFIPLLRKTPGFVSYNWLDTGSGVGASIGVFQDKAGAEESVRLAATYAQQHMAALLGKPDVTQGEVKVHA
ncbi:MAG TPA: hypothetical protein VHV54_26080 [Candidatus Binatia bacterium]|nr:hypothetical protein [Candidatus Binatia bacterium]